MSEESSAIAILEFLNRMDDSGSSGLWSIDQIHRGLRPSIIDRGEMYDVLERMFKRGWLEAYEDTEESGLFRISAKGQIRLMQNSSGAARPYVRPIPPPPPVATIVKTETETRTIADKMRNAIGRIDGFGLTNAETSQAKAYLAAALAIAEAPTPKWEIIKDILMVISVIAGIGGTIAAILALI